MYKIQFEKNFKKILKKIPKSDQEKILETVESLSKDPRHRWLEKMKGIDGYRVACGSYRIIYKVEDDKLLILILDIDGRKDVYKKK